MLTSEMKSYIKLLEGQKNSITSEITNLKNSKETIEKLSKQIKSNVTELNKTISRHQNFQSLATGVQEEMSSKLQEIKAMDKKSEITGPLDKIVQDIGKESLKKLEEVKRKFLEHEEEFKQKIFQQVKQIKSVLRQLDNGSTGKIKTLKNKILELVGNTEESNDGSLGKLLNGFSKIGEMGELRWNQVFKGRGPIRDAGYVLRAVRNIWIQKRYYQSYVNGAVLNLKAIRYWLDQFDNKKIISEIEDHNDGNIDEYKEKINEHQDKLWKLDQLSSSQERYKWYLGRIRWLIKHLNYLKLKENKDKLCDTIQLIVDGMENIEYRELKKIDSNMGEIIDKASTAQRHLRNTQRMFEYLKNFRQQKEEITSLSINGTIFEQIEETISEVQSAYQAIEEANRCIKQARKKLEDDFEEDYTHGGPGGQGNGEKEKMMPEELDIKGDEFQQHKTKLEAIQKFNNSLNKITPEMSSLNGNSQQSNGSDVQGALDYLNQIDKTLSSVYKSTDSAVTEMQKSYEENKSQINGGGIQNGNGIESYVVSIGQIPNKIAELQSKVKYYIVLLNIAKAVNVTLNDVKGDGENLKKIKGSLEGIKHRVEFMNLYMKIFCNNSKLDSLKVYLSTVVILMLSCSRMPSGGELGVEVRV